MLKKILLSIFIFISTFAQNSYAATDPQNTDSPEIKVEVTEKVP
jgi:hypothetical protein